MKRIIIAAALTAVVTTYAQISPVVNDLAEYVYPANRPAAPPSFVYAPDGNGYLMLSSDLKTVDRYDITTGKKIETIFDVGNTRETTLPLIQGFEMSKNGRYLLVYYNSEYIYRRSFTAEYFVYEVRTRLLKPLSTEFRRQQSPVMSSDGRQVAFVAENNIYIHKNDYNSQVAVTKDGEKNKIINGVPDWVYEEEFSTNVSMVWSPDNLTLCYLRYDEEAVPMYTLPLYQGACNTMDQYAYYPGVYSYKYPLPGNSNSKVTVHSYDVETRKIKDIALPDSKIEYIPRIAYGNSPEHLMVVTLNRDQNHMEIYSVNPKSTVAKSVYTDDAKAWIAPESYESLLWLDDGFLVQSSRSGYNHVYKYSYAGAMQAAVTKGDFDVTDVYGYDAKGNFYYQSAEPSPIDRVVRKIDVKGRITTLGRDKGTTGAKFSPDKAYAMFRFSDADTPPVYTINASNGKQLRVLEDNAKYAARYADAPRREFFTMNSDGNQLNGYIVRSKSATGRQPVVMYQYSGPGSQSVLNTWQIDWDAYFAMNGFTVVCVDGRGTGGRGRAFMDAVYQQLGRYETIDQVNAARWVAQQPWADSEHIGIYGWSYGGYETLMCATEADNNPYAAAVAVAPVTSWRYYDSVYTERYMRTPQQNEQGYYQGSPLYRTSQLACPTLIMYGTADDNVHPQNSIEFVSRLQSNGGLCDMFIFPNMNHSISGCNSRAVVYAKMYQYFTEKLR